MAYAKIIYCSINIYTPALYFLGYACFGQHK